MKHARIAAVLVVLSGLMAILVGLPACCTITTQPTWEARFLEEFDFSDGPHAYTTRHKIPVRFPYWLQLKASDGNQVLAAIDSYWDIVCECYPWVVQNFDPSGVTVWIHDAPGAFVVGDDQRQLWAHGWAIGSYAIVAWSWNMDGMGRPAGIRDRDPLSPLIHEWFHHILAKRYSWADPTHVYFSSMEVAETIAMGENSSIRVDLSSEAREALSNYRYWPWSIPGRR